MGEPPTLAFRPKSHLDSSLLHAPIANASPIHWQVQQNLPPKCVQSCPQLVSASTTLVQVQVISDQHLFPAWGPVSTQPLDGPW